MIERFKKINFSSNSFVVVYILLILFLLTGICENLISETPVFFSGNNILDILLETSVITIISVGMTFIIITAGIDLSVGASLALCNVSIGLLMLSISITGIYFQALISIFIGLATGSIIGFANGYIIVKGKIPPFIVTLGMMGVARGLSLHLTGSQTINLSENISHPFFFIGNGSILDIPFPIILALLIVVIFNITLNNMRFGRHIIATGANEEAAKFSGINTNKYKILVYTVGGFLVGIAGIIQTSRLNSSDPHTGSGFELYSIAAVIIGGTSFMGGKGTIFGTLFGALIISVLINGLRLMNISGPVNQIFIGFIIIGLVLWDRFRKK